MSTVLGDSHSVADVPNQGDSWRTIGKHPLLELRHTIEDRLLVATHISFLGLRAMMHRNNDRTVLFSDTIDEPKTAGNAVGQGPLSRPPDRLLILTDKHLYVVSSPSTAFFSPSSSGSCYSLSEFSRMAVITNANSALMQFVGGIVAARFTSKRDCERCATAMYTATGIATETLTAEELGLLHQRRSFGNSTKLARFVSQTVRDAHSAETSSNVAGSEAGSGSVTPSVHNKGRRILRNDNGSVTNTVDNMLRFVLDGDSELGQYDAGFPDAGVQASCSMGTMAVQAKPETCDASTSPMDASLSRLGGLSSNNRSYARRLEVTADDSDDDGAGLGGTGDNLWSSLRGNPSAKRAANEAVATSRQNNLGDSVGLAKIGSDLRVDTNNWSFANSSMRKGPDSPLPLATGTGSSRNVAGGGGGGGGDQSGGGAAFDSWLGVLAVYRSAMEKLGITTPKLLMRIPQGQEWESFLDACGITRAGHRVLLTTKVNASRK